MFIFDTLRRQCFMDLCMTIQEEATLFTDCINAHRYTLVPSIYIKLPKNLI